MLWLPLLDVPVAILCLSLSYKLYTRTSHSVYRHTRPQGYILQNQVTHARLLPAKSAHAFTYPTLSFLVSLDALENHVLDLGRGWVFGYGGLWGRLTGLRSNPYLADHGGKRTIRQKLEDVLSERGLSTELGSFEDAWMMTMPSFMGFEGINPLTVYFCYRSGTLWLTVLEIHNTFGESHVHVLEIDKHEDVKPANGYDHQWTFLREFHVSPFNDRSGFYTVSIKTPSHAPTLHTNSTDQPYLTPRPAIRIHLHTSSSVPSNGSPAAVGALKLTALLRPTSATPLTITSLLFALSCAPFTLFLALPRILYEAWILHYRKRLDVFLRPEPLPALPEWYSQNQATGRLGGGIKWLGEGLLERYARTRVETFLTRRVEETGISVSLIAANPTFPHLEFLPSSRNELRHHLTISYLSPRFFTIIFLCPSASHALLLGNTTEQIFFPSSQDLFLSTFSSPPFSPPPTPTITPLQRLRSRYIPPLLPLDIPSSHALDTKSSISSVKSAVVIWTCLFLERLEAWVFRVANARPVKDDEQWKQWERALKIFQSGQTVRPRVSHHGIGSVRREEESSQFHP